jgi:hypothetical protein
MAAVVAESIPPLKRTTALDVVTLQT